MVEKTLSLCKAAAFISLMALLCGCASPRNIIPDSVDRVAVSEGPLTGDGLALQGRWIVLRKEMKLQTTPELNGRSWIFQGRTFRLDTDRGSEVFAIDESANPKRIDFADGRNPVIRGIYALEGDRLIMCTGDPGEPRPQTFSTSMSTGAVLTHLKRAQINPR